MNCLYCFQAKTVVVDSRLAADQLGVRRRRRCVGCNRRFTTLERAKLPPIIVRKNDGSRQVFSRKKILVGIMLALQKTDLSLLQAQQIADKVVRNVTSSHKTEVTSRQIGKNVLAELKLVNKVAYLRFKSVYGRFKTIAGFKKEISTLQKK